MAVTTPRVRSAGCGGWAGSVGALFFLGAAAQVVSRAVCRAGQAARNQFEEPIRVLLALAGVAVLGAFVGNPGRPVAAPTEFTNDRQGNSCPVFRERLAGIFR